jgi:hypothetical protein
MRTDWAIRFEVCEKLVRRRSTERVFVSVRRGEVRLSGRVANRRARNEAVRIASDVEGVRAIRDELDEETSEDFAEEAGPKQTEFGDERAARAILSNDFDKAPP